MCFLTKVAVMYNLRNSHFHQPRKRVQGYCIRHCFLVVPLTYIAGYVHDQSNSISIRAEKHNEHRFGVS